ncbi:MAG: S8 family peptidase [Bdellovibrionia bacterium]
MQIPRMALLLSLTLGVSLSFGLGRVSAADFKPGELIVKYKSGAIRTRAQVNALYQTVGVKSANHFSGVMTGFDHWILDEGVKLQDAIHEVSQSELVEYAQPNYVLHVLPIEDESEDPDFTPALAALGKCWFPGVSFPPGCEKKSATQPKPGELADSRPALQEPPLEVIPSLKDPDLSRDYGMAKIRANEAWAVTRGSKEIVVADIDTGIDYNHEDLAFNVWRNPNPGEKNDIVGFDFVHNDGLPYDDNGHGTHTAGTIGAVGGNGIGTSGVIQRVSIMSLKFLDGDGSGTTADAIRAIDYAIEHGARVLSNSWGGRGDPDNPALKEAIDRVKAKDVLFVAAAGNDGVDNDGPNASYPAAFTTENLISVAATDERDGLASFSNYGKKTTHLAAPGVKIYSTAPGSRYKSLSGTSMACPHVAGAAALLWSIHPNWGYQKIKEVLLGTVDPVSSLARKTITGGRLNVGRALNYSE